MDAESSPHAEPTAGTSGPVRVPPNVVDITPDGDSGSIAAGGNAGGRPTAWPSARRVSAAPGEAAEVRLRIPARAFARYSEREAAWVWPPGTFTVQVGRSSRDLPLSVPVRCG